MRNVKLSIPVKTYVRKYIEAKYPGHIKLGYRNTLGSYIYVCLEKEKSTWHKKKINLLQKRYELLKDSITVLLPSNENTFYKTGFSIPITKSILINDFFEDKIIEEINFRCNTYHRVGFSRNQAIEDFCEEYNIIIDVDITFAAFKKAEYRYRKMMNKNRSQMSPLLTDQSRGGKTEILPAFLVPANA